MICHNKDPGKSCKTIICETVIQDFFGGGVNTKYHDKDPGNLARSYMKILTHDTHDYSYMSQ